MFLNFRISFISNISKREFQMATNESILPEFDKKSPQEESSYSPSLSDGEVIESTWEKRLSDIRQTFLTKEGWIGDYVGAILPSSENTN